ncbi:MAG TPA: peptide chain release factor 3, partial [Erythrobacter sp.]|nr:peptide chain release factor 3 [Erythrobacter sp.]
GMGGEFEGVLDFASGCVARPEGPSKEFLGTRDCDAQIPERFAENIELAQIGYPEFDLEAYRSGDLTPVYFG